MIPHNRLRGFDSHRNRRSSPLLANVAAENVSDGKNGEIRIALGKDWFAMLDDLRAVGSVLSITRNTHAVIGRGGLVPELDFSRDYTSAGDRAGEFDFEFSYWQRAQAVHTRTENGNVYSIEWLDAQGCVHHKTCLTTEANLNRFVDWVTQYQNFDPEWEDSSAPTSSSQPAGRIGMESEPSLLIHRGSVDYLFREAISHSQAPRLVIGNDASVQGHSFTPTQLRHSAEWCFLNGENLGIYLRTKNLAEVILIQSPSPDGAFLTLKLYEPEGRLVTVIAPPLDADLAEWNAFLTTRMVPANQIQPASIEKP